jgi:periplasmic divalent cation tolerance protein
MDQGSGPVQVTVTFNGEAIARQLARSLVEERLAACAQVSGPISSTFRWQGAVRVATEWHCFVKTTADRVEAVERHIAQLYPADTPEVIAVPIVGGSAAYLDWIRAESAQA